MENNLYFCLSSLSVPKVISLINHNNSSFFIYTNQESIKILFEELYGTEHVLHLENSAKYNNIIGNIFFVNSFLLKKKIWKIFKDFNNYNIYFFHNAFSYLETYVIKKLSKRNYVFYKPDVCLDFLSSNMNLKVIINLLIIYINYGILLSPRRLDNIYYYIISQRFLKKNNIQTININVDYNKINELTKERLSIAKINILYLIGGSVEDEYISEKEYVDKNDKLLNSISKFNITVKLHPRYSKLYSLECNIKNIPSYIPANILISNTDILISYSSAALFEFSNCGKTSISLLKYFKPESEEIRDGTIQYLNTNLSESKIYYPQNITEIIKIIETSKN